ERTFFRNKERRDFFTSLQEDENYLRHRPTPQFELSNIDKNVLEQRPRLEAERSYYKELEEQAINFYHRPVIG
ncbi:unnamed protein product, partial [Amoebophrya sp. A25]